MSLVIKGVTELENESFEILRKSVEDVMYYADQCADSDDSCDKLRNLSGLIKACRYLGRNFESFNYAGLLKLNALVLKKDLEEEINGNSKRHSALN